MLFVIWAWCVSMCSCSCSYAWPFGCLMLYHSQQLVNNFPSCLLGRLFTEGFRKVFCKKQRLQYCNLVLWVQLELCIGNYSLPITLLCLQFVPLNTFVLHSIKDSKLATCFLMTPLASKVAAGSISRELCLCLIQAKRTRKVWYCAAAAPRLPSGGD